VSETALVECDFCSDKVPEAWYVRHGGFEFYVTNEIRSERVTIEEGRMAACPTCWHLVQTKDTEGLTAQFMKRHPEYTGRSRERAKLYSLGYHGGVLKRLIGKVEHVLWFNPKPKEQRFYTYTCHCGEQLQFDSSTYRRSTYRTCPKCGCEISIIGKPDLAEKANLS
jgi:hypothetical protein